MDHYEMMEELYKEEKGISDEPYTAEGYAKKMHKKELEEMSKQTTFDWKDHIVGKRWDFATYCREYEEKLRAHEASKAC